MVKIKTEIEASNNKKQICKEDTDKSVKGYRKITLNEWRAWM